MDVPKTLIGNDILSQFFQHQGQILKAALVVRQNAGDAVLLVVCDVVDSMRGQDVRTIPNDAARNGFRLRGSGGDELPR